MEFKSENLLPTSNDILALLNIDSSNKIKKFIAMEKPMINCPKCQHSESRKDGIVRKKQRYLCKSCGYRDTVAHKGYSEEVKQQALAMYLEGLGFRSIGRLELTANKMIMK